MRKPSLHIAFLLVTMLSVIPILAECDCTQEGITGVSRIQCEALVAFYNATRGAASWPSDYNWNTTSPVDDWSGVVVEDGAVTQLLLPNKSWLKGSIPPEIGNLVNLEFIDLSRNRLSGAIPPEIGNLVNVINIYLDGNMLSGPVPPEIMNMESLRWWSVGLSGYTSRAGFNLLYTDDPEVESFMNGNFYEEIGSDRWSDCQTLPPEHVEAELLNLQISTHLDSGNNGFQHSKKV